MPLRDFDVGLVILVVYVSDTESLKVALPGFEPGSIAYEAIDLSEVTAIHHCAAKFKEPRVRLEKIR